MVEATGQSEGAVQQVPELPRMEEQPQSAVVREQQLRQQIQQLREDNTQQQQEIPSIDYNNGAGEIPPVGYEEAAVEAGVEEEARKGIIKQY